MRIRTPNENWDKINTKKELIEFLKRYKGILNDSMISYLNSLIELEFSVIRDYIDEDDRIILSELEVYKRIAMYNIYNRALEIFKENIEEFEIFGNNCGIEGLTINALVGKRRVTLFDFNYETIRPKTKIPINYNTMRIGNISLFQTIESAEKREAELMRVINILHRLYDEKNPYHSRPHVCGGPAPYWRYEHSRKIKEYEKQFEQLDTKKELTDEDKREIEITKQFYELLLEDYGLTNKSFDDKEVTKFGEERTKLYKTLVKELPNITIKNNIKYI